MPCSPLGYYTIRNIQQAGASQILLCCNPSMTDYAMLALQASPLQPAPIPHQYYAVSRPTFPISVLPKRTAHLQCSPLQEANTTGFFGRLSFFPPLRRHRTSGPAMERALQFDSRPLRCYYLTCLSPSDCGLQLCRRPRLTALLVNCMYDALSSPTTHQNLNLHNTVNVCNWAWVYRTALDACSRCPWTIRRIWYVG